MDLGVAGRVVLITGGSSGIGLATAECLAEQGARVAICARGEERLERAATQLSARFRAEVLSVVADISTPQGAVDVVDATLQRFGELHGLVNNAGASAAMPFESIDDAAWQADLDTKLFGAIRVTRGCLPALLETRGAIVNVVAIAGKHPGARSMPSSVSRAAGLALTKALSKEYGPLGVRVNAVCIGAVESGQNDAAWQRTASDLDRSAYYARRATELGIPLGRVGTGREAGDVIAFLLSDRASYVTGVAVNIDGGLSTAL
jgi:NAD(P)-dependent dehydrogenase (short-subunit alcohol dehydrogenase family)